MNDVNNNSYLFIHLLAGITNIIRSKKLLIIIVIYIALSLLIFNYRTVFTDLYNFSSLPPFMATGACLAVDIVIILSSILGLVGVLARIGTPLKSKPIQKSFERIGLRNHLGEVPILVSRYVDKRTGRTVLVFENRGIPIEEFDKKYSDIEVALNYYISEMEYAKNIRYTIIYTVPVKNALPECTFWFDSYLKDDSTLILGESLKGTVSVDLNKTPHLLIGGSTGSGKTLLLKLLLMQCIKKGYLVHIADFKGGVDYSSDWHNKSDLIFSIDALINILEGITNTLNTRKLLFKGANTSDIEEYNKTAKRPLPRIIFACDEVAELLDKTGADKAEKEKLSKIEHYLATIARQGRAFGIHLILSTQRPDANILSGQIKNNCDYRICGKADKVLSSIILDTTDAAEKIPKNSQGRFIDNSGVVFQAYYFDDKHIE